MHSRRTWTFASWLLGAMCAGMLMSLSGCDDSASQCNGPIQKSLRYGCSADMALANTICCHNTMFAERSGYFEDIDGKVGLFGQLDASGTTTFYDSVCGLPLFKAPAGRSFEAWHAESRAHGWPSFRSSEIVSSNVVITAGGEMHSVCGTHLGHNIPDTSGDRYCIDLVCIAGEPNTTKAHSTTQGASKRVISE
eukprot:TRINITY_DN37016_c0_g1_i1.p1 TRINITY_DN37016_c0_g1~~TRINITY_DN37016_c0_g1_i1.p1  ORF type:complete len:194 (+),score=31.97 TRINITY_DN37016_c0_g1_i1:179-760(+)